MPIPESDGAVVPAAGNASGAAFLLSAADAIRKRVAHADVVNLRGWLVVPGTPRFAAIHGDRRPLIADQENDPLVDGIDADVLIVVAAGRAAKTEPGFSAVGG